MSIKLPTYLYNDLQKLKAVLKVPNDSAAIKFCITYTIASLEMLDEKKLTDALAIALGQVFLKSNTE